MCKNFFNADNNKCVRAKIVKNSVHIINSEDLNVQVHNKMMTLMYRNHRHQIQSIKE